MKDNAKGNQTLRRSLLKLTLVLFDIFAVNFAYYMALVLRFYVNHQFHLAAEVYMPLFRQFAPYYTVCCIVIFWLFKLYNGMWRYAGFNDVNRIVWANAATCAVQIVGTMLFTERMPRTYYALGAMFQFLMIFGSRFLYRVLTVEMTKLARGRDGVLNAMLVGAGEMARGFLHQMESDRANVIQPVCVLDLHSSEEGRLFDGLPVLTGIESIPAAIKQYEIKNAIIVDPLLSPDTRKRARLAFRKAGIEVRDYTGYLRGDSSGLSLQRLMEYTSCPVTVWAEGEAKAFENGEDALRAFPGLRDVKSIAVRDGRLLIELVTHKVAPLVVFYITNRPDVALIAEKYGVDRIWIDLEKIDKDERQRNMNTVKSQHTIEDVAAIKPLLTRAELLVRINHWYEGSKDEIDAVVAGGADIIMLPYWKTVEEVDKFLAAVNGRCKTSLLLETKEAVDCVDEVLKRRFDEIHIGLNDLSISYGYTFMFELLSDGTVEMLCRKFRQKGIPYGFGGIARLGDGLLPAEKIIMEHYRLGSTRAILSRTFCDQNRIESIEEIDRVFRENMETLKEYESSMADVTQEEFIRNKMEIAKTVDEIVAQIKRVRSNEL